MNNNLYYMNRPNPRRRPNYNDERFGFLGPFLLGGITGGLVAPFFYQQRPPYPYYTNNYYYQYPPYYYY